MELLLDKKVKLFNGKEVSWDEFSRWSAHRQMMNLTPVSENITYGVDHCHKMREIVKRSYQDGTRRANWNYGAKNGMSKAVMTPAGEFPCLTAACLYYKISITKLKEWMRNSPEEYFYTQTEVASGAKEYSRKGRVISTPEGVFPSIKAAARHFNVGERTIKTWIRRMRADEFKYI
jgi:Helix-turn-helix domain